MTKLYPAKQLRVNYGVIISFVFDCFTGFFAFFCGINSLFLIANPAALSSNLKTLLCFKDYLPSRQALLHTILFIFPELSLVSHFNLYFR
jgi:hypothetical protein